MTTPAKTRAELAMAIAVAVFTARKERLASGQTFTLRDFASVVEPMLPLPELVQVAKAFAIHSRIADLRKQGHRIANLVERTSKPYRSFYRYTP